jgi:hypothetical protein
MMRWNALVAMLAALLATGLPARAGAAAIGAASAGRGAANPICGRLGHSIEASAGAQMYCFGAQQNGPGTSTTPGSTRSSSSTASTTANGNTDAASLNEDVTQSGARAYGQSETSVAAAGPYVVEAWNDATSLYSLCPSPKHQEEGTGLAFSIDGGKTFTDLGGLPNDCTTGAFFQGDPSVEALQRGGSTYFYVSSLYEKFDTGESDIALDACVVAGTALRCSGPIVAATSLSGFLDKDFLAIDPGRSRLYVTYTRFDGHSPNGQIELAVCGLGVPSMPTCHPGGSETPYLVISAGDPNCEQEGSYPAVDRGTGAVYVAWEYNWFSGVMDSACENTPTQDRVAYVPLSCLPLATTSRCPGPLATTAVSIVSMELAPIPGYNRFPMNDYPRIAVSDPQGTVSIVWNDARFRPLGDILLQSWKVGAALQPVQTKPAVVDSRGAAHFLPALRLSNSGTLLVGWYERATASTTITSYAGALRVKPAATSAASEVTVTTASSDWSGATSDIIPNFGDYTDVDIATSGNDVRAIFAWTDGRLSDPQPFTASILLSS